MTDVDVAVSVPPDAKLIVKETVIVVGLEPVLVNVIIAAPNGVMVPEPVAEASLGLPDPVPVKLRDTGIEVCAIATAPSAQNNNTDRSTVPERVDDIMSCVPLCVDKRNAKVARIQVCCSFSNARKHPARIFSSCSNYAVLRSANCSVGRGGGAVSANFTDTSFDTPGSCMVTP